MADKKDKNTKRQIQEDNLDEALDDSFPASDPPAQGGITGTVVRPKNLKKPRRHSQTSGSGTERPHGPSCQ